MEEEKIRRPVRRKVPNRKGQPRRPAEFDAAKQRFEPVVMNLDDGLVPDARLAVRRAGR